MSAMTVAITFLRACCPAASIPAFSSMTFSMTSAISWQEKKNQAGFRIRQEITTQQPKHQPHLEVLNGDLVLGGMSIGKRLQDRSVVSLGLQELTKFFQHNGSVGRNSCITCQLALGNASKLGEELLSFWIFCE